MYLIYNGRVVQRHYITALEPIWCHGRQRSLVVVREGFIDCGPAPALTRKDRALMAMQRMERDGRTARPLYDLARKIALREIFG